MSILITGGAGYIGSHCNKVFVENGYHTIILDNLSNGHREAVGKSKLIVDDIGNKDMLTHIFSNNDIEGVVHLAAKKSVEESVEDPKLYYEENVVKTKILLDTMVEHNVNNIVFSSTASVYGDLNTEVLFETNSTLPVNPYGESKLIDEKIMRDYDRAYDLKYCSLRYFNAAGADSTGELGFAGTKEKNIMPLLVKAVDGDLEFTVYGDDYETRDGTCIRDYIHVSDLAEAHLLAFEYLKKEQRSEIINLGTNNGYSVLDLIKVTEDVTGKKMNYKVGPRRSGDPRILVASNKKAVELLRWTPKSSDINKIVTDSFHWDKNRKY